VLPAAIADTAYRIVREGLTNAIKHAPGARVGVRLAMSGDDVEIEVSDDGGTGAAELAHTGAGLGLIGMRERVESSGGTVEAGPDGARGWRMSASVPVPARAAAATAGAR
jgi:signal transduction histidine kinase